MIDQGVPGWNDMEAHFGSALKTWDAIHYYVETRKTPLPSPPEWDWNQIVLYFYDPHKHACQLLVRLIEKLK